MTTSSQEPQTPPTENHSDQESQSITARPNRLAMETKMVSRLQDGIDESGRYAPRLKDLSVGFAAAKGVSEIEARKEIAGIFRAQMGASPQEYLEQHRVERGLSVDKGRADQGRGR